MRGLIIKAIYEAWLTTLLFGLALLLNMALTDHFTQLYIVILITLITAVRCKKLNKVMQVHTAASK